MNKKIILGAAVAMTLIAARHRAVSPPKKIDIRRSLVVTEPAILEAFSFERVLQTLIDRSGSTITPLALYRQWFDTQNPRPGLAVVEAPHCDDFITNGQPSFNGFPRRCPTPEGVLAVSDPFPAHDYIPIGITNRFDLMPADASNCGQYRLIYAKTTVNPGDKLHIIFEGILPNPNPVAGIAGCRPVAQFWADLSDVDSLAERRVKIERFFFDGIEGLEPVLMPGHFAPQTGRVRTSQLSGPRRITRFYQFHLRTEGSKLLVVPGLLENLAHASLFNASTPTELGPEFRQVFISQVPTLAVRDLNGFYDRIPDKFLIVESDSQDDLLTFASDAGFNPAMNTAEGKTFNDAIAAELLRAGSDLRVADLLVRVDLQQCQGCHLGNVSIGDGLAFPAAMNGTHIDETLQTTDGVARFAISPALRDVFAPNRAKILTDFLSGRPLPVHTNSD